MTATFKIVTAPVFQALLALQDRDAAIARLRHRHAHPEELAALTALEADIAARQSRLDDAVARRDEAAKAQKALEDEMAAAEARIAEVDKRMYSGTITASRDLQAMADEVKHLKDRVSGLEDHVLEAMEVREPLDAEVATITAEQDAAQAEADRLRQAMAATRAAIEAELAVEVEARAGEEAAVPADLRAEYDQLRAKLDGVGAARLVGNQCTGCHLALSATEVDQLRRQPEDALLYCENCGRILVR